jgi:hypothetical protein
MKGRWRIDLRHQGGEGFTRMWLLMAVRAGGGEPAVGAWTVGRRW